MTLCYHKDFFALGMLGAFALMYVVYMWEVLFGGKKDKTNIEARIKEH
jgi:hypothetical protein